MSKTIASIIPCDTLRQVKTPHGLGPVFSNEVRKPETIDFASIPSSVWKPPYCNSAYSIFRSLVSSFDSENDQPDTLYAVADNDLIHGHYGLDELTFIVSKWRYLPAAFRKWAGTKSLYGWRGVMRDRKFGVIRIPYIWADPEFPSIYWMPMHNPWRPNHGPALRAIL